MTKTIASIYPMPSHVERPLYSGIYDIPAVQKGDPPFLLKVEDKVQVGRTLHIMGHRETRDQILGEQIADDICKQLAENAPGMGIDCGPGIWVVREEVTDADPDTGKPFNRPATEAEKAAMFAEDLAHAKVRQAAWMEYQIISGDRKEAQGKYFEITPLMKLACRYMGRERKWLEEMKDGDVKRCRFCTQPIPANAIKCPKCQEIVDPEAYAREQAKRSAVLASMTAAQPEAVAANPQ
jgi:predicted nucleic acid-binding Zn ribbon protein